jgi:hypothetical protein
MRKATEAKAWQREAAGRSRSSDGRFTIEQQGAGRWFLADRQQFDEMGQPRLLGPFTSLARAKAEAEAVRGRPAQPSALAARIAKAPRTSRPLGVPRPAVSRDASMPGRSVPRV